MSAVQVRTAVEAAFRDFNTASVPGSGAHEPVKSEIRYALGRLLESVLSSIGAGLVRFQTKALMDADTTRADGILAYVWGDATEANRNVYQWDGAAWVVASWYFDAVAGVVQPLVDDAEAARDLAQSLLVPFTFIEQEMRDIGGALSTIPTTDTTGWNIAAGFGGVGFVADGDDLLAGNPDGFVGSVKAYLQVGLNAARVELTVYRRLMVDADENPGSAVSDVSLFTVVKTIDELGLTAAGSIREVEIQFPPFAASSDYSYVFAVETYGDDDARKVIGFGQGIIPAGEADRYAGFYRGTPAGAWGPVAPGGAAAARTLFYPAYISVSGLRVRVVDLERQADMVDRSFSQKLVAVAGRTTDGSAWPATDAHFRWAVGIQAGDDIAEGQSFSNAAVDVELSASVDKVVFRLWKRPTDAGTASTPPGSGANDEQIFIDTLSVAELGMTAASGFYQACEFPFESIIVEAGTTYIIDFTFYDDANTTQGAGIQRVSGVAGLDGEQRGFYDAGSVITGTEALAWRVGNRVYVAGSGGATGSGASTRDQIVSAQATPTALDVAVEGEYGRAGQTTSFSATVSHSAPTTGNASGEAITLTAATLPIPPKFYHPTGSLAHANVSAVVVKDASTMAVLIEGVDYLLNEYSGVLSRADAGADRAVVVDYHWSKCRYDLICVHAETRALSIVEGTERDTDSGEFLPTPAASFQVPLFYTRVADGFDLDLTPVWYLDGTVHRDLTADRAADYARQRQALEPVLRRARAGLPIVIAGMGDSILGQEGGYSPTTTPNTSARDRPAYFSVNIGADRIANVPLYDLGDGDGAIHTRTNSLWALALALADLGGDVTFYNFGIGGTASAGGVRQGDDPALRAAVWALNPHVLGTHYGMNETGSDNTEANLVDLFTEAFDNGVDCVFAVGMPRPSSLKNFSIESVRKTWRATRRAAEFFENGAYFAAERLVDDDYRGAMKISTLEYGAADRYHHPGIHECETYQREIKLMVRGS